MHQAGWPERAYPCRILGQILNVHLADHSDISFSTRQQPGSSAQPARCITRMTHTTLRGGTMALTQHLAYTGTTAPPGPLIRRPRRTHDGLADTHQHARTRTSPTRSHNDRTPTLGTTTSPTHRQRSARRPRQPPSPTHTTDTHDDLANSPHSPTRPSHARRFALESWPSTETNRDLRADAVVAYYETLRAGLTAKRARAYSFTYSKSAGCPSIPRFGGAIQLANFPGSYTGFMIDSR